MKNSKTHSFTLTDEDQKVIWEHADRLSKKIGENQSDSAALRNILRIFQAAIREADTPDRVPALIRDRVCETGNTLMSS